MTLACGLEVILLVKVGAWLAGIVLPLLGITYATTPDTGEASS